MEFGWTLRWIIESQNRSQFAARGSCRRNAGMFRIVPECASQYRRCQNEATAIGSHARSVGKWLKARKRYWQDAREPRQSKKYAARRFSAAAISGATRQPTIAPSPDAICT